MCLDEVLGRGGFKAVGKTVEQAKKLYDDIKILENIGVWAVEVEVIPENIMAILSPQTSLITSSLGSGVGDIQFLFAEDSLSNTKDHIHVIQSSMLIFMS